MRLLTKCCFKVSLKAGTIMLLSMYWIISVTYLVLLVQYFSDHTVPISILIGVIFIIWTACSIVALYGVVSKKNAYYLIPEIVVDIIDCFLHLINLIYRLFKDDPLIPRFTVFGVNKRVVEADKDDRSFQQMVFNLLDERYPLPNLFAFIDLCVRLYFLIVLISYLIEFRNRRMKKSVKKAAKKANKTAQSSTRPTASTSGIPK